MNDKILTIFGGSGFIAFELVYKLSDHFNKNKKDNHSRQGLLKMIMKRRSLMKYLKKTDMSTYENLIKELGLRK